jgi:hypothetical protein
MLARPTVFLPALVLLAGCASGGGSPSTTQDAEFALPPEVQQAIAAHARAGKPVQPLASYVAVAEIDNKGNFGKKVHVDERRTLTRLDSGLVGIVGDSRFRDGSSQGSGRELTLCGLIPLLRETSSTTETSGTTMVPAGKVFVPFGLKSRTDFNNRFRVVAFEASVSSLCDPAPGTTFTYRTETEFTTRFAGQFLGPRTNTGRRITTATCRVSPSAEPAGKINPALKGEALGVTCETEAQAGAKSSSRHVFLREAGYYLLIEQRERMQDTSYQYSQAQHL